MGDISSHRHIFKSYIYLILTPISKTSQPIYRRRFIALIGEDFILRRCNTHESVMLRNKYTDTCVQKGNIHDSPAMSSTPVQ